MPLGQDVEERGFTLVEFAVVMVCIGILVAGVLKWREMTRNARVTATIAQVQNYQKAYNIFQDTYRFLPGDMPAADVALPNCEAGNFCFNGDGDRRVGDILGPPGFAQAVSWGPVNPAINLEHAQFWRHLALAGLLDGVATSGDAVGFGLSIPASSYKGGFFARWCETNMGSVHDATLARGNILVMRGNILGEWGTQALSISPYEAAQIDRKSDDGLAFSGNVRAISMGHIQGCGDANSGVNDETGYSQALTAVRCEIHFMLEN